MTMMWSDCECSAFASFTTCIVSKQNNTRDDDMYWADMNFHQKVIITGIRVIWSSMSTSCWTSSSTIASIHPHILMYSLMCTRIPIRMWGWKYSALNSTSRITIGTYRLPLRILLLTQNVHTYMYYAHTNTHIKTNLNKTCFTLFNISHSIRSECKSSVLIHLNVLFASKLKKRRFLHFHIVRFFGWKNVCVCCEWFFSSLLTIGCELLVSFNNLCNAYLN